MTYFNFINSVLMPDESKRTQEFLCAAHYNEDNTSALTNGVVATVFSTANTITYLAAIPFRLFGLSLRDNNEPPFFERVFEQITYSICGVRDAFRSIAYTVLFCAPYLAIGALGSIFYSKDATRIFTYAVERDWLEQTTQAQLQQQNQTLLTAKATGALFILLGKKFIEVHSKDNFSADDTKFLNTYNAIMDENFDLATLKTHEETLKTMISMPPGVVLELDKITDSNIFQKMRNQIRSQVQEQVKLRQELKLLQMKVSNLEAKLATLRQFTIRENPNDDTARFFIAFAQKITEINQKNEDMIEDEELIENEKWIEAYSEIMHKDSGLPTLQGHENILQQLKEFDHEKIKDLGLERFKAVRDEISPQIEKHLSAQDDFINQIQNLTKEKDAALEKIAVLEGQLKEMTKNRNAALNKVTELENALKTAREAISSSTATPSDHETKGKGEAELSETPSVTEEGTGPREIEKPSDEEVEQSDGEKLKAGQSDSTSSSRSNSDADQRTPPRSPSPTRSSLLVRCDTPRASKPLSTDLGDKKILENAQGNTNAVATKFLGPDGSLMVLKSNIEQHGNETQKNQAEDIYNNASRKIQTWLTFLTKGVNVQKITTEGLDDIVEYKGTPKSKREHLKLSGLMFGAARRAEKELDAIWKEIEPNVKIEETEQSEEVA